MLELVWPWLLLLLPLPLLFMLRPNETEDQEALRAPLLIVWRQYQQQSGSRAQMVKQWMLWLVWVLLVVAISRPQWIGETMSIPATGRDLLVSVDISGSMEAEDLKLNGQPVNRLVAVKHFLTDFIERRQGDRVGLILFGENAYLQTPLTFDLTTVSYMLDETEIGLAGPSRTAIGDGIGLAVKHLQNRDASNRVLILLTDGQNNTGTLNPAQAAELAEHAGVTIYTIGIGAESQEVSDLFTGTRTINPSRELDERTLTQIAQLTGGQYFRARNSQELETIYDVIDQLQPVEDKPEVFRPTKSLFHIPLLAALALLLSTLIWRWFAESFRSKKLSSEKVAQNLSSAGSRQPFTAHKNGRANV